MTHTDVVGGRPSSDGRPPPSSGPVVTVQEDLATGATALVVTDPAGARPAREVAAEAAADYLDGAGMVLVEQPLTDPVRPELAAGGLDLVWVHRDLAAVPPAPAPELATRPVEPDPALTDALVAAFTASLGTGCAYAGTDDLLRLDLADRVRDLLAAGTVRWAALERHGGPAFVLWQQVPDPVLGVDVVDLVDICGAVAGAGEALLARVAAAGTLVRGNVAVSPDLPLGWTVLAGLGPRWRVGAGRWRFAVDGDRVLPWRAAPPAVRRTGAGAAARAAA